MRKKSESLKGKTREILNKKGPEAAKSWALSQTDRFPWLKESHVLSWFRTWGLSGAEGVRESTRKKKEVEKTEAPPAPTPKPDKLVTPTGKVLSVRPKQAPKGRRVYDAGEPNVHGTVITDGPEVSVVKWDVASPWGRESNTPNEHLRGVESEPPAKDMTTFRNAVVFKVVRPNGKVKNGPKGVYREDETVSMHDTFAEAIDAATDSGLWVFAQTKGGSLALLMRPHWGQFRRLEAK